MGEARGLWDTGAVDQLPDGDTVAGALEFEAGRINTTASMLDPLLLLFTPYSADTESIPMVDIWGQA